MNPRLQNVRSLNDPSPAASWLHDFPQDVRYGWRMLRKSPGFSLVAILTIALGIGASTAVFTVINTFLLNPLPIPNPSSLVALYAMPETADPRSNTPQPISFLDLKDYENENGKLFRDAWPHSCCWTLLCSRSRSSSGKRSRRGDRIRHVAAQVRRKSVGDWPFDLRQRNTVHDHRRCAAWVQGNQRDLRP